MKRLLIFLLCSVLALSSLSFAAGAAEHDTADTSAQAEVAEEAADINTAEVGATADEIAPTGWSLLTEAQFQSKLSSLRSKYPNGSVWGGVYYENGSAKATTCWAYAAQMLKECFGVNFYADGMLNYKYYDANGITAGDWVRIDWDSHSIFITKVIDSGVYYTDGNGTGVYNQVRWDGYYSWSELRARFSYRLHLPGNTLTGQNISHTVAYNANGGSGSMSSQSVEPNGSFSIKENGFSRPGYTFVGYTVQRSTDSKWFTSGGTGWQTKSDIYNNGYRYSIYFPKESYKMSSNWIGDSLYSSSSTLTFYAQWVPEKSKVEFLSNYSGYNYMLGSNLGSNYGSYIKSRDTSNYTVSVDSSEQLNGSDSLKITGKSAGSTSSDLAFVTSTNEGFGNSYSPAGTVGDDKTFTLHFYAKASVDGAKMYFRWGYTSNLVSVSLSKSWKSYFVSLPKNRYCGYTLHPYFDKAGTYYLNSLALGDNAWTSNIVPETGTWAAPDREVARDGKLSDMPQPEREGYDFLGWFTAAEGGEEVTTNTVIDESVIRLYAHWKKRVSSLPVNTVKYNGHMYELYDNTLGWEDAENFCEDMGGHLITIESKEENTFAYDMISGIQGYCWIGLNCVDKATDWQWVDGTSFSYKNWFDNAYDTTDSGEYYGLLYPINYGPNSYASKWDKCKGSDYFCSFYGYHNSFFICEYDDPLILGDVDGSSEVDSTDATLIQRKCTGKTTNIDDSLWARGDVNSDNETDIIDVTYIQRYLSNLATDFAIGEWIR